MNPEAPIIEKDNSPDIIVLKFADSKVPVFKETRDKDYVKYGDDNRYPEYLTYLFDKSAKHNAILTGKAKYIFGDGFENGNVIVNRLGETLNDISRRCVLDIEIYGGFRVEIVWNALGKIAEMYHVDYTTLRLAKGGGGYYYKETWDKNNRDEPELILAFNPNQPVATQIYAYNEYRPMVRFYPLPSYIGCNNYIETDIEISKFNLSAIRNGMAPSKMIQFFKGEPSEDKKREIEARFQKKFAGAENAGKFVLVFNDVNASKSVEINDLSASEIHKQFEELNKTTQQEIFSGHNVTSPMLFGIKTEGQLGGSTELATSYAIFQNTYSKPKATAFSKEIQFLLSFSRIAGQYELRPTDPIGIIIPDTLMEKAITPDEVRERLGLPVIEKPVTTDADKTLTALSSVSPLVATKILDNLTQNEIRGLAGLAAQPGGDVVPTKDGLPAPAPASTAVSEQAAAVNDSIKNLTAKQHQQVMRIIRQYSKGQLTELAAKTMLRTGLGLSEDDINNILGIEPAPVQAVAAMSFEEQDEIIGMFDACGESKRDFEILKSKKVIFSSEAEAAEDEEIFKKEAFKGYDVTTTENEILELIRKDKRITPEVIAETIGETVAFVKSKLDSLTKRGYLESTTETIGPDEIIERTIPKALDIKAPTPPAGIPNPAQIYVKYSYEVKPGIGPSIIATTRPFCRKMVALNRLYSRADIEKISVRLGYSVFDRKGGWWGGNPECRHRWQANVVVKKEGLK